MFNAPSKRTKDTYSIRLLLLLENNTRDLYNTFNTSNLLFSHIKRFRFPFVVPSSSSHFDLPAEDEHDHLVLFSNFFCWFWLLMMMMIMIIYLRFLSISSAEEKLDVRAKKRRSPASKRERETDETRYCNLY